VDYQDFNHATKKLPNLHTKKYAGHILKCTTMLFTKITIILLRNKQRKRKHTKKYNI
jgi:hypothetical protein